MCTLSLIFSFPSYFKLQTTSQIKGYCFSRPISQLTTCKAYVVKSYKQGERKGDLSYSFQGMDPALFSLALELVLDSR